MQNGSWCIYRQAYRRWLFIGTGKVLIVLVGEEKMQVACNSDPCPIDGGWSDWYDSVPCTATCGSRAMRRQQRDCNNPEPVYGGEPCQGSKFKCEINIF